MAVRMYPNVKSAVWGLDEWISLAIGAWTVNHANKTVLKISLPTKKRPWMQGIFSQINNLSPPF